MKIISKKFKKYDREKVIEFFELQDIDEFVIVYTKKYKRPNPQFLDPKLQKFRETILRSIRHSLTRGYTNRSQIYEVLGCSCDNFKKHLEMQFLKGMTWDNRSEWHIDHITPLYVAKTKDDLIKLNHYSNLRPLWSIDNIKKGSKF